MTVGRWLRIGGLSVIALGFLILFSDEIVLGPSTGLLPGCPPFGTGECFSTDPPAYEPLLLLGILLIAIGIAITLLSVMRRFNHYPSPSSSSQNGLPSGLS